MPLGIGYFYDRRHHRYHRITEHATDAVTFPRRFRSQEVAHLNPTVDRATIVRHVAAQGFIRVRLWKADLGWEFHGDPDGALRTLRRFITKEALGGIVAVNLTDFATHTSLVRQVAHITKLKTAAALGFPV